MNLLNDYYTTHNEDVRLLSQHGQVEYLTTMKYIGECLEGKENSSILEVGAATGRYSVTLAKQGYDVTAVELVPHNIDILKSKLDGTEKITVHQGNALDLSFLPDESFDVTMVLGPLYHLFTQEDKLKALKEAVRVTRKDGYILVAYCMNEPTIIQYAFGGHQISELINADMLTADWHCKSEPKEIFELARTEDIAKLDAQLPVERVKLVATDGASHYLKQLIDEMDQETFSYWMEFHLATCERQDLIGGSNHTLDILRKK